MSELPVIEKIAIDILNTVASVTEEAGYQYTLKAERYSKGGEPREHLKALIVQDSPLELEPRVYYSKEWQAIFNIGIYLSPDDADTTPIDTYRNIVTSDLTKSVMQDIYRNKHALNTSIKEISNFSQHDALGDWDGVVIQIAVQYRTLEIDPYIQV